MATKLGAMAVGSTVKIKVDGRVKDFIVVHQGNPDSTIYDSSCNGTWVLLKDVYTTSTFGRNNSYKDSKILSYLSGTFYNLIDSNIRAAIKRVKIPYWNDTGSSGSLATGSNGLSAKIFLLSSYEVGERNSYYIPQDGAELDYFGSGSGGDSADDWWLRSPATGETNNVWCVDSRGSVSGVGHSNSRGVRPAFILPFTLSVSDDGTVSINTAPAISASSTNLGEKNTPFDFSYTVTDADSDLMTVTEKLDGEAKLTRTEVATGTALTVDWLSEKSGYQQVLNGAHTLTLTVSDGKTSTDWTATFTKNVTGANVSLTAPLTADDTITVAALTLEGSFPTDLSLTVEMTNNALDETPVWENCTDIQSGESRVFVHHAFTNKTAARGFSFNYKVTVARGTSGVGGTITMIGGVIG